MANLLIDYNLKDLHVSNPDGSLPTTFTNCNVVPGPGQTHIGKYDQALDFQNGGKGTLNLSGLNLSLKKFCIRLVFCAGGTVSSRQNLVESNLLPFSIHIVKGSAANTFDLLTTVKPKHHNWCGPDTLFKKALKPGQWYTLTFAYDYDTAALFIDEELVSVHAFPKGRLKK